jgi:hypothetical protein
MIHRQELRAFSSFEPLKEMREQLNRMKLPF